MSINLKETVLFMLNEIVTKNLIKYLGEFDFKIDFDNSKEKFWKCCFMTAATVEAICKRCFMQLFFFFLS